MKKLLILLLVASSCSSSKKENQQPTETSFAATLTEAQKTEGWRLLFDGQTLNGWKIFKDRTNNTWEVKEGALHCKPLYEQVKGDGDERSDIITVDEFENFELAFDWKISEKGNSGVMFRVTEELEQPYFSGPEYQVKDDTGFPETPKELKEAGANYDMHAPGSKNLKPVGEWNSARIIANGKHVEHWLNGQKILEYELGSADWQKRKDNSKWKNEKGYGMTSKGHIDFQDHGQEVWYRNIMIKAL